MARSPVYSTVNSVRLYKRILLNEAEKYIRGRRACVHPTCPCSSQPDEPCSISKASKAGDRASNELQSHVKPVSLGGISGQTGETGTTRQLDDLKSF